MYIYYEYIYLDYFYFWYYEIFEIKTKIIPDTAVNFLNRFENFGKWNT